MKRGFYLLITYFLSGCIEPYNPPEVVQSDHYLVVDGFLDIGKGEATVTLSRTQNLEDGDQPPVESGAQITIQEKGGREFSLPEVSSGVYSTENLDVGVNEECRLFIRTSSGKEYASDYVEARTTPPIDSVTWKAETDRLNIQVTTHDETGQTEFYRWSMVETVQYYSMWYSAFIFVPETWSVRPRTADEQIFTCWKETSLSNIKVATSRGLAVDLIDKFTLVTLDASSWKHKIKYSLLVKQYAIGEDEYDFWNQLKKNTESVGTIFDPQPSEANGNVRSLSNPSEPVLGYFSVSTEVSERIFIHADQLPYSDYVTGYEGCNTTIDTLSFMDYWVQPEATIIVNELYKDGFPFAYGVSDPSCIDCRIIHGGVTSPPDYWR